MYLTVIVELYRCVPYLKDPFELNTMDQRDSSVFETSRIGDLRPLPSPTPRIVHSSYLRYYLGLGVRITSDLTCLHNLSQVVLVVLVGLPNNSVFNDLG